MHLIPMILAVLLGQHESARDRSNLVSLQPTQIAEIWIENGGELVIAPKPTGNGEVSLGLGLGDLVVNVKGQDCRPAETPDFAQCSAFSMDARGLRRLIDLRPGLNRDSVSNELSAFMVEIEEAYEAE